MAWKPTKDQKRGYNKKYWRENADTEKNRKLIGRYGITLEEFNAMRAAQGGCCAICGMHEKEAPRGILQVDHCHKSGGVRTLLCACCNGGLGNFKDSPALLRAAAEYLERQESPWVAAQVLSSILEMSAA